MHLTLAVFAAFFAVSAFAQSPDLVGFATTATQQYVVQTTEPKPVLSMPEKELAQVVLREETGAVRDTAGRVTWFGRDGRILVKNALGAEFKLSQNLLAVYTPKSQGAIYDRDGHLVFQISGPVRGMSVAETRVAWIDDSRDSLELRDVKSGRSLAYPGVQTAWLSDSFLYVRFKGMDRLYGRNQRVFPSEYAVDVRLSNDLAVVVTRDGRVKVYSPDDWRFTRADVKKVVLTSTYLALTDATGIDVYHRNGTLAARFPLGERVEYQTRVIAIRLKGGVTQLIAPQETGKPKVATIPKADAIVMNSTLAIADNGSSFEVYGLENESFGKRLFGGPRTNNPKISTRLGVRTFGFLSAADRAAQLYQLGAQRPSGTENALLKRVLDEKGLSRLDLSDEDLSLNWTMF